MNIEQALLTINRRKGRRMPADVIVIHVTEGSAASVRSWFNAVEAEVSAHYMVTKAGAIVQFVQEIDEAWAQGRVEGATAEIVLERPGVNPNSFCLSIEHEGNGRDELTDAQRTASVWLIRDIARRHSIPLTRRYIIGHHEIYAPKPCPGAISVDRLVADAQLTVVPAVPTIPPRVVWSPYFNDWLVVTRYVSDTDWSFVRMKDLSAGTLAKTPLSQMLTERL